MKIIRLLCIGQLALAIAATAQVPTFLNYQGYLQDASGNPATGSVNIAIALYTNASGGTAVYNENIGTVALDKGIYSFSWGSGGTSVVEITEILAIANGTGTIYNSTTTYKPIINPSVTVSDGTYSWNDVTGSTSPTSFLATVSSYTLGTISAIYISQAPKVDTSVNISYKYNELGVIGALENENARWMELVVNNQALLPRQRLMSVPFASLAQHSVSASTSEFAQHIDENSLTLTPVDQFRLLFQSGTPLSTYQTDNAYIISEDFSTGALGRYSRVKTNETTSYYSSGGYTPIVRDAWIINYGQAISGTAYRKVTQFDFTNSLVQSTDLVSAQGPGTTILQGYVIYYYQDRASYQSGSAYLPNATRQNYVNPYPSNKVTRIDIMVRGDATYTGAYGWSAVHWYNDTALTLNLPTIGFIPSHTQLLIFDTGLGFSEMANYQLRGGGNITRTYSMETKNSYDYSMAPDTVLIHMHGNPYWDMKISKIAILFWR